MTGVPSPVTIPMLLWDVCSPSRLPLIVSEWICVLPIAGFISDPGPFGDGLWSCSLGGVLIYNCILVDVRERGKNSWAADGAG